METNAKTALIVDDEEDLRDILQYTFESAGFVVATAKNGRDAFEVIQSKNIDLVICDIQMPGGGGVELLDRLRKQNHDTPPLVFISGFSDITLEEAYARGAEGIFAKPFDSKGLVAFAQRSVLPKEERWKLQPPASGDGSVSTRKPSGPVHTGPIRNLGRGGAFIEITDFVPELQASLRFQFEFSGEGRVVPIEGTGVVKWVRSHATDGRAGYGIEFVDLTDDTRGKAIGLINSLNPREYIPKE